MLKPGVRTQLRIICDDKTKDGRPDVTVEVEANLPVFGPNTFSSPSQNIPVDVALDAIRKAGAQLPPTGQQILVKASEALAFLIKQGGKGMVRVSVGDQDNSKKVDVQVEIEGQLFGFHPPVLNVGPKDIPLDELLQLSEKVAMALPSPANGIAVGTIELVRFALKLMPV